MENYSFEANNILALISFVLFRYQYHYNKQNIAFFDMLLSGKMLLIRRNILIYKKKELVEMIYNLNCIVGASLRNYLSGPRYACSLSKGVRD